MPLARVQIDVRKAELVKALRASEASTGPFQSYADVMTFAAAVGVRHGKRLPISKQSRYDPDAVPQDQFKNEAFISMVAVVDTLEPKILSETDDCDYGRVTIFQEYANGGLEVLEEKLKGTVDYSEQILLILKSEFIDNQDEREVYDLKDLIGNQL